MSLSNNHHHHVSLPSFCLWPRSSAGPCACIWVHTPTLYLKKWLLDWLSWNGRGMGCPGKSKYCQWDFSSQHYADLKLAIPGACTSTCTEFCSNYYCNGGCFKSWGWFKGYIPGNNYAYPQFFHFILKINLSNRKS